MESYPCPICGPDKVFLTVNGLERHSQEVHPLYLENVKSSIERIQNEWNRRRNFRLATIRQQFEPKSSEGIFNGDFYFKICVQ